MKVLKNILFVLVLVVMIAPSLQKELNFVIDSPLNGDFVEYDKPDFSWTSFYNGSFQTAYNQYFEQHIGFHNTLVRIRNQLDYSLFRKPNAEGIVIGKNDFIFEYDYIRELTGRDYVGGEFIDEKLRRLQYVQEYLKKTNDIDFIIVFLPGKASFYQEYLPDKYVKKKQSTTNYTAYLHEIKARGIKYIDVNQYFHQIKAESPYPLFPRYGTHWSIYGMSKAAHVIIDSIEQFKDKKLNEFNTDSLYFSIIPLRTDYDGGKALNLTDNLSSERFAYPYYIFGKDSCKYKPKVLTIGDSFYWNIFNAGIPQNLFVNEAFWYYNSKIYPEFYIHPKYTNEINLKEEVENMDVIFIMVTERFLNIFDWGLIDQLYYLYTPEYIRNPIYDYMNKIVLVPEWFNNLLSEALAKGTTNEQELYTNAKHMYQKSQNSDFMSEFGMEVYKDYYRSREELELMLRKKAVENNLSYEEMLQKEADYLFKSQQPDIHKRYISINKYVAQLENDSIAMDSINILAKKYYCKIENMVQYQAKQMLAEESIQAKINLILSDDNWTKKLKEKAREKNISFEEMLRKDALYLLQQNKK